MDDHTPPYGPSTEFDTATLRLALHDFSASSGKPVPGPMQVAISPGPPIADYRRKKRRDPTIGDMSGDLATMLVRGHA